MNLFSGGYLPLEQRVAAENLYFAICHRVRDMAVLVGDDSEDIRVLIECCRISTSRTSPFFSPCRTLGPLINSFP